MTNLTRPDLEYRAEVAREAMSALQLLVLHHDGDIEPKPFAALLGIVCKAASDAMPRSPLDPVNDE